MLVNGGDRSMNQLVTMVRKMRELKRNEPLTREQLEELKLGKFRELVRHAQRNVDELPADPRSRKFRLIVDQRSVEKKRAAG